MKQHSSKLSPDELWKQAQSRAKEHAKKTGIPFHLWLLQSQKVISLPSPSIAEPATDLHRAFREELLS
jgi:hypothetical protein